MDYNGKNNILKIADSLQTGVCDELDTDILTVMVKKGLITGCDETGSRLLFTQNGLKIFRLLNQDTEFLSDILKAANFQYRKDIAHKYSYNLFIGYIIELAKFFG